MGYSTTTTTISVPIDVGYVCSKCGHTNLQRSIVKEWAESYRQGTIHLKSTYKKMAEESREDAEYHIGRRMDQIVNEAKINRFRKAELKCKCEKCNHVEPWAKMRFTRFEAILAWFTVMSGFISLFAFLSVLTSDSSIGVAITFLLIAIAIPTCWSVYKKICYFFLEKKITELPKKSLPTLFLKTKDDVVVLNPQLEREKKLEDEKFKKITTIEKDTVFCRKCGSEILIDSMFCSKCGAKVEETKKMYDVCIFDASTHTLRKEKKDIDIAKFPPSKFADNDTYYAIETFRDGKKIRIYHTKDNWNKQIEIGISEEGK